MPMCRIQEESCDLADVSMILALICVRYLDRRQRARELLSAALRRLRDQTQIDLANQLLAEIDA